MPLDLCRIALNHLPRLVAGGRGDFADKAHGQFGVFGIRVELCPGQGQFADADKGGLNGQPARLAIFDHLHKAVINAGRQERQDAVQFALVEGGQDHLISAARAAQEFRHAKGRLDPLHRLERGGGSRIVGDIVGDVGIGRALNHLKPAPVALDTVRLSQNGFRGLFKPLARAQDRAQFQDQEHRNPGNNDQLNDGRVHPILFTTSLVSDLMPRSWHFPPTRPM